MPTTSPTFVDRSALLQQVTVFFDAFVSAFQTFDGNLIAQRYTTPYLALNTDGSAQCFDKYPDIGRYFQGIVRGYYAQDCRSCRYKDLDVGLLGSQSVLTTVTWELLREDGRVLNSWRESYILTHTNNEYRILASVDHAQ
jgi:hypothetical protein